MKVKIDFQLNRRFGIVDRLIFRLVLNGFSNAREIALAVPIFSDAVISNAIKDLVNEQIISADIETGTLSLSEAIVAIIAMCQKKPLELDLPVPIEKVLLDDGTIVFDNNNPESIAVKDAIIKELFPKVKLDLYRYSLDFSVHRLGGDANE